MTYATGRPFSTMAIALCALSGVIVAIQIGVFAQWSTAFDSAGNQADRVLYFLTHLPLGLGRMGTTNLTLLSAAVGAIGLVAALVAARGMVGWIRFLSIGLAVTNGLMILWYGFTML
ncbi:hypothetical protein BH23GEM9_BH23GEM9_32960 [soil metagenome]